MAKKRTWSELSEEYRKEATKKKVAYARESGWAAQKAYRARVLSISVTLHPDNDADVIALFDRSEGAPPLATQLKELLREVARGKNDQ